MRAGRWLPTLGLLLGQACTCSRRPHVSVTGDGGPAVVMVDRAGVDAAGRPGPSPTGGWSPRQAIEYVEEREPDDDLAHAQPFEHPRGVHGRLLTPPGSLRPDVDLYQWVVNTEGRSIARIELTGPPEVALDVLSRVGDPVVRSGSERVFPNLAVSPGEVWFLRVRSERKAAPAGAEYRLVVSARPAQPGDEEEPNDSARHATLLVPGVDFTGYYGWEHDDDWFALPEAGAAPATGGTMRIELSPVEGVLPAVRLRDVTGKLLLEARGLRAEELRLRNLPLPGHVVLRAESGHNTDVPWQLRWSVEPTLAGAEIEPNQTPLTATRVDVEPAEGGGRATVAGYLWPGDVDCYRVRASAPGLLDVEVLPPEGVDVRLEQVDPDGSGRGRLDKAGPGKAERLARVPMGGEALLRVSARPGDTAFDAPYQLTVSLSPLPPGTQVGDGGLIPITP